LTIKRKLDINNGSQGKKKEHRMVTKNIIHLAESAKIENDNNK